jgi:hypothetical protein
MASADVSFLTFFLMWAKVMRWDVPMLHVRVCQWLETCEDPVRVLMVFRGAAKSTLYAVYKAWKLYRNRHNRSLVWAADDKLATKLTRDTLNVLHRHPLTQGMLPPKPGAKSFWVTGAQDARNASIEAVGVNGNSTGSRADAIDFDDVEVPKNIKTPEARQNLRLKIEETTHIAVPGAQKTYIGTPHTHDSIYTEQIEGGASVLKIPLFSHVVRYEDTAVKTRYRFNFTPGPDGLYVLAGIGKFARMMREGADFKVQGDEVVFYKPPAMVLDICAGNAWPERFNRVEVEMRRKETRTLNGWDSQYQLEAKPVSETRLDPNKMVLYEVEPVVRFANGETLLMLGNVRLVGVKARWDCSLGKINSDASAVAVVFTDDAGRLYWHRAIALTGELEEFGRDGKTLVGGQIRQLIDLLAPLQVPSIVIETNGPGGFVPAIARKHLKRHGISVTEDFSSENKQKRILDAFEAPLSSGFLWAHTSVTDGPAFDQMIQFNPLSKNQADDYLDSGAGAISETPVRIGRIVGKPTEDRGDDWRPSAGVHEVTLEM